MSRYALLCFLLASCAQSVDHTPTTDLVDEESSTLETGVGVWQNWFSTRVRQDAASARSGAAGLSVSVVAPNGWGVQVSNWPGFKATPGLHRASFWARQAEGESIVVDAEIAWRDTQGDELKRETLSSKQLLAEWERFELELTAPEGTAFVTIAFVGDGEPGAAFALDEIHLR
ncbi:MAG: hypothetical protein ACT4TC_03690 [Myxococcaceae bacterium]